MLTSYGERWRVVEASRIGINEYLVKPISAKALYDRLVSTPSRAGSCRSASTTALSRAGSSTRQTGRPRPATPC
jgi:DNA-binding response OmpR family regulator